MKRPSADSGLQTSGTKTEKQTTPVFEADTSMQLMPVPIGPTMVARIPYPMTEDDYNFFLDALKLYKRKLVKSDAPKDDQASEALVAQIRSANDASAAIIKNMKAAGIVDK